MNIDEIRAEIPKVYGTEAFSEVEWIREHGQPEYPRTNSTIEDFRVAARILVDWAYEAGKADGQKSGVLFEAVKQVGFDEAAKDPNAWCVPDTNGDPIHRGDVVKTLFGKNKVKYVFYSDHDSPCVEYEEGGWDYSAHVKKVIPDTREKIKEELGDVMLTVIEHDLISFDETLSADDLAEQFISRIEALVD